MPQRPGAIAQHFENGLLVREAYSSTCAHCQRMTEIPSKKAMMEHVDVCRGCMRLICLGCVGKPCVPFEKRAERLEELARLGAKIHRDAWGCY